MDLCEPFMLPVPADMLLARLHSGKLWDIRAEMLKKQLSQLANAQGTGPLVRARTYQSVNGCKLLISLPAKILPSQIQQFMRVGEVSFTLESTYTDGGLHEEIKFADLPLRAAWDLEVLEQDSEEIKRSLIRYDGSYQLKVPLLGARLEKLMHPYMWIFTARDTALLTKIALEK